VIPIVSPFLIKLFSGNFARAIALYPFVIFKEAELKEKSTIVNHEKIHLKQQAECLLLPFYAMYLIEYMMYRIRGKSHYLAYRSISFEREAFDHEEDPLYLERRAFFAWIKYL
jgi:hypothetical protein